MKITIKPELALAGLALALSMLNAQAAETRKVDVMLVGGGDHEFYAGRLAQ